MLCGPSQEESLSLTGEFGIPANVVICKSCGLIYLNPRWDSAAYQQFYRDEYEHYYGRSTGRKTDTRSPYVHSRQVHERLTSLGLPVPKRILEIGAGMGWNLQYLRDQWGHGVDCFAIEPSLERVQSLENDSGIQVIARDVDSDWTPDHAQSFDLIILRHVLEHMLNPLDTLKKAHDALAPGGIIYIAVPDMMSPSGSLRLFWYKAVHTYYFSQETLRRITDLCGLRVDRLHSEQSELWGTFRASETKAIKRAPESVYEMQLNAIREYTRNRRFKDIVGSIYRYVPDRAKACIPSPIKNRFF